MRTWFLDMDGVMADFDRAFPEVFGLSHKTLADDEMWLKINSHGSFFRDLPPCPGALEFFKEIERLEPVILTACPKSDYENVARQKRAWVRHYLSKTVWVLPVLGGSKKPLFMHQSGDVLIDDYSRNCEAWVAAGGQAIQHLDHDFCATRIAMAKIIDHSQFKTTAEFGIASRFPRFGVANV